MVTSALAGATYGLIGLSQRASAELPTLETTEKIQYLAAWALIFMSAGIPLAVIYNEIKPIFRFLKK